MITANLIGPDGNFLTNFALQRNDLAPDLLNIDEPVTEQELTSENEKHIGLENTYEPTCDIKEVNTPFSL